MRKAAGKKRKPRRSFGAVRKLNSGSIQASYLHEGKRYAKTFPPKTSEKDVDIWLSVQRADIARGDWTDPDAGSEVFRDYAEDWLARGERQNRIRPSTADKYRSLLDHHLLPTFGNLHLRKITPRLVHEWYDELAAAMPPTAAGAYRLLSTIFNRYVRDHRGFISPCDIEGASKYEAEKRPFASMAEAQAAIDSIPPRDDWFRTAVMLAAWGQLRRGEVLGLQRGDIDLVNGTVNVERTWNKTSAGKTYMDKPKTRAGVRKLAMPSNALAALERHLQFVGKDKAAWLFPSEKGDSPINPNRFGYRWNRCRAAIGRPELHYHDLRASGLTWAAQKGATHAELMHRGGHANVESVMIYQRAAEERDRELAQALNYTPQADLKIVSGSGA